MPYISTEALIGAGLLGLIAFGSLYVSQSTKNNVAMPGSKAAKKKSKKKSKLEDMVDVPPPPAVVEKKGKKGKRREDPLTPAPPPIVEQKEPQSFAEAAKPKTLAQKIAPQPRKTKVDDMLAPEDQPATHARVMKIIPAESTSDRSTPTPTQASVAQKIPKFEEDYAESSGDETSGDMAGTISNSGTGTGIEEDDGWDMVPIKKKKPISISTSSSSAAQSTALPLGVSTKLQRKNQAKSAAKKAATEAAEADRLQRLAQHKKGLERERINEIYSSGKKAGQGKGKVLSGGATATVTSNGKLVWD